MRSAFVITALSLALLTACASSAPVQPAADSTAAPIADKAKPVRPFPEDSFLDLLVAEFAMRQQDFATALDNYAFQAQQTGDLGVIATAARLAQYLGKDEQTLKLSRQWVAKAPNDPEALFNLASILSKLGQPLAALPYMRQVVELGEEGNFAALAASALALPQAQQQVFSQRLDKLAEALPQDASIKIARALLLQYQEQEEQALSLVREVLNNEADNPHALLIETRTLSQLGRDDEARERLRYAVDQLPSNRRLRHDLARNLVSDKPYEALAHYQVLVRQYPNDEDLLLELMLVNRELDNDKEAEQQLENLQDNRDNSSRVSYILGRIAEEDRKWEQALSHYQKAMGRPEFEIASRRIAAISMGTEGNEAALKRLQQLRQRYPEYSTTFYLLASEILRKDGHYQRGIELLNQAIDEHPDNRDLRYNRSLLAEATGDIDSAEADLRQILAMDPDNAAALNALGYTLANHGRNLDEAEQLVKRALAIEPNDAAIIDSYGWVLFLKGELDAAVEQLEKAFALVQDHEIAAHLGEALWKSGQKQRAREIWQEGLKDTPDSAIIMDTLRRLDLLDE